MLGVTLAIMVSSCFHKSKNTRMIMTSIAVANHNMVSEKPAASILMGFGSVNVELPEDESGEVEVDGPQQTSMLA